MRPSPSTFEAAILIHLAGVFPRAVDHGRGQAAKRFGVLKKA